MQSSVRAFAPATVSNLGCAFDILGFALEQPGDEVRVRWADSSGVRISSIQGDGDRLPADSDRNTASVAAQALLRHLDCNRGLEIDLVKRMPLGSGLGSSAASAAAALTAVNALLEKPLPPQGLLPFAVEAERAACGAGHADNAAPSLLGGIVLIRSYDPLEVVPLPSPPRLWCTVAAPAIEVRTEEARGLLSQQVPLEKAVSQWGNVAGLIAGILQCDYALIGRSLEDVIIEPQRAHLVPGYHEVKQAALEAGALGCGLSGSGPSTFALSSGEKAARRAGEAMQHRFGRRGIEAAVFVSQVNQRGAHVVG